MSNEGRQLYRHDKAKVTHQSYIICLRGFSRPTLIVLVLHTQCISQCCTIHKSKTGRSLNDSGDGNVSTPCITLCIHPASAYHGSYRQWLSELAPAVQSSAWSQLAHSCTAAHQLNCQLRGANSLAVARHAARDVQSLHTEVEAAYDYAGNLTGGNGFQKRIGKKSIFEKGKVFLTMVKTQL